MRVFRRCPMTHLVDPLQKPDWDAQLEVHPRASLFHSASWARVLRDTYGYTPLYLVAAKREGSLVLPLMEVNSRFTGKRGISLPFTDQCEPLGFEADEYREALEQLKEHGRQRQWKYWEIRGGGRLMPGAKPSITFFSHSLELCSSGLKLFENFDSSVRRAIRKAEKLGVKVELSQTPEGMRRFYELHCRTRRRHGLPPQPFSFFLNIQRHLIAKGLGFLVLGVQRGKPIAAALFLQWGKQAAFKFGASDQDSQDLRGNNLVMWHAIQTCVRNGLETMDLGRTSPVNEGLRRFKLGWGTAEKELVYFKFDLRKNSFVSDTDNAFGWYNQVLGRAPISFLRVVGKLLYPHMA